MLLTYAMPGPTVHSSACAVATGNNRKASAAARNVLIIRCSVLSSVNPASTNHHIIVIKDHGLAWGDRDLRLIKGELRASVLEGPDRCRRRTMTMTDLSRDTTSSDRRLENPVHARRRQGRLLQRHFGSHHHLPILWLESEDIQRCCSGTGG